MAEKATQQYLTLETVECKTIHGAQVKNKRTTSKCGETRIENVR